MSRLATFFDILFWPVCALYAGLLWLTHYPPLADFPHHVAQVAMLHDILLGQSPWAPAMQLHLNLFTPYLIAYLPAAALSFLFTPLVACKLVLLFSFVAFIWCGRVFFRHYEAPRSLLWVLPLSFHGFAWQAGLFTFVAATPFVFLYIVQAAKTAETPNNRNMLWLGLFSTVILFSHLLVGLFSIGVGGLLLLARHFRNFKQLVKFAAMYVPAATLLGVYILYNLQTDTQPGALPLAWNSFSQSLFLFFATATDAYLSKPFLIRQLLGFLLILMLIPATGSLLGLRWQTKNMALRCIPIACLFGVAVLVPYSALDTEIVPFRFSLLLLPFLTILLTEKAPGASWRTAAALSAICLLQLLALTSAFLFARNQSATFAEITAALPPGQTLLSLSYESTDRYEAGGRSYITHPVYYQVERGGWVDFSYTVFRPQIVRQTGPSHLYRHGLAHFTTPPTQIAWDVVQGWRYDYVLIWSHKELPADYFAPANCTVEPVSHVAAWRLFRMVNCKAPAK